MKTFILKKLCIPALAALLWGLALNGCSNVFFDKPRPLSGGSPAGTDIPEGEIPPGFGAVTVTLSRGAARTIMPQADLSALYLDYWFAKDGGTPEGKTPQGGVFILEGGTYSLTVKAFTDSGRTMLAAEGTTDSDFTITAGMAAGSVNLRLHPVVSEGTGALDFSLSYPAGAVVETLTLTHIAGEEGPIDLAAGRIPSGAGPLTLSGRETDIPAGYYLLRVVLRNAAGDALGRTEAVHIYQNLSAAVAYTFDAGDFTVYRVTTAADSGPGSLRQALADAVEGQTIRVTLEPGSVIALESTLPEITTSISIEGNGVTLTQAASSPFSRYQLLYINSSSATVTIQGVHFKNSLPVDGGAVRNRGTLTLESCVFSSSYPSKYTGAGSVYSTNDLAIRGCTFYNNSSSDYGGAVYFAAIGKTLTLTGNLFYENTALYGYPVVYNEYESATVRASYNVTDTALGTADAQSGWAAGTGDLYSAAWLVSPAAFKPFAGSPAAARLPAILPAGYPATDFYGQAISGGGAAGAVQALTPSGYVYPELSVSDSQRGSVSASPVPDSDGMVPAGSVTFTASLEPGCALAHWLVDGTETAGTGANQLALTLTTHTRVQAVFTRTFTVTDFTDGAGSAAAPTLRYALTNVVDGDSITLAGVTPGTTAIELQSRLPGITTSITIEGNGVTLTRAASWTSSSLLSIGGMDKTVTVRGVHFKNGLAANYGGAVRNNATLTLESCIFSGNRTTAGDALGGAVHSFDTLTIRGCTFYKNNSDYHGGAVYFNASGKTLTLTGNLFYGNTVRYSYPVVYIDTGTVRTSYNVTDTALGEGSAQSGWAAGTGDFYSNLPLVSPVAFKPFAGSPAAARLPAALPAGYPTTDFYGQAINGSGAAGAVQALTPSGYVYLDLSVNNSQRGSVSASPVPDSDGMVPAGSVTLTVSPNTGYSLTYWLVNGAEAPGTGANQLALTLAAHTRIQAVFTRTVTVTDFTGGVGSAAAPTLRYALANAQDGDVITLSGVTPGTTAIELESPLPQITTSITIEGNGVTLTRAASWTSSSGTSLLYISGSAATVTVRGVHFKNGLAVDGGAVWNNATLTLESCVFSGNRATNSGSCGGAVYSTNDLAIRGCTFYNNSAGYYGGAVYFWAFGRTLTLTGNLFYGNTAPFGDPVVSIYAVTVSASYNLVDTALGEGSAQSGWAAGIGDFYSAAWPVSGTTFKVFAGSPAAARLPAALPAGYPATDFYGQVISGGGAAGAVQALTPGGYVYLDLSVNNSQGGSVSASVQPDADGLVPLNTVIAASPNTGYSFAYWLADGLNAGNANPRTVTAHTRVQAVFTRTFTVTDFTGGAGSAAAPTLRYALANAQDGDVITLSGVTPGITAIELGSALPQITTSITIEGNGVTLTRASSWTSSSETSQLLYISGSAATVTVRGVHFKNGLATQYGGAVRNDGTLTLESCVFSGNRTTNSGTVYSTNDLAIRGCTFYNNAAYYGGAVHFVAFEKTLTLTGNLFYGNTALRYPVVYNYYASATVSASYNVTDTALGEGSAQSGWAAGTGDLYSAAWLVSPAAFKVFAGSPAAARLPVALPAGYPATDFYGQVISGSGAAGAVQALTPGGYVYLDLSVNNSQGGSVSASVQPDADGLVPLNTAITASPNTGYSFAYWLADGLNAGNANPRTVTAHTRVQAVFSRTVTDFTDGAGSAAAPTLRYALANAQDGDVITLSGVTPGTTTIELQSPLPGITQNIVIEGNGVTLTRAASWTSSSSTSQLLYIVGSAATVTVRGVHFKNGLATGYGGAVLNSGILTLESCVFSGNRTTNNDARGGAIYSDNNLTIRGSTFYNNSSGYYGGAVYFWAYSGTLTLTGNLFYGNTALDRYPVVYYYGSASVRASYNVTDTAFGTGSAQSGWYAGTGDTTFAALGVSGVPFNTATFAPASALQNFVPSGLTGFPAVDFYGNARISAAPGAVGH
jgi:predicted outer membrane repeat protein